MTLKEFINNKIKSDNDSYEKIKKFKSLIKIYTLAAWILVALGLFIYFMGWIYYLSRRGFPQFFKINELGDFIAGGAGSTWALAGLLFIFVGFIGQKIQLELQGIEIRNSQYEVRLTRLEMKKQSKEAAEQSSIFLRQNFEAGFFKLVEIYKDNLSRFKYHSLEPGHDSISKFMSAINYEIKDKNCTDFKSRNAIYMEYFYNYEPFISPYLRILYRIFKYIDEKNFLEYSEKYDYASIIRATLSSEELELLYFNGLSIYGSKFKFLIEKYSLFKHIDPKRFTWLSDGEEIPGYQKIAFSHGEKRFWEYRIWKFYAEDNYQGLGFDLKNL